MLDVPRKYEFSQKQKKTKTYSTLNITVITFNCSGKKFVYMRIWSTQNHKYTVANFVLITFV